MGFPRILSKNHKIYTKLGEFCLSGDSFWIVCHTCQEELQTQDQFWKHIQDEHNFLHGFAKEHTRTTSYCLADVETGAGTASSATAAQAAGSVTAVTVPLALYHCATKYSEDEQREVAAAVELHEAAQQHHQQQQQQQQQHLQQQQQQQRDAAKELAELHANVVVAATAAAANESNSSIDIKVEPTSTLTLKTEMQATGAVAAAGANNTTTIYHLPQVVTALATAPPSTATSGFISTTQPATIATSSGTSAGSSTMDMQGTTVLPTLTMAPTAAIAATGAAAAGSMPMLTAQVLQPKYSNSTTASASSAMSSDDGERWYVCDYETCGLKFKYKSRMELHRVVHSKERRFNCDLCNASFKQSCNLSTHRKKKHAVRGIKSDQLPQRF